MTGTVTSSKIADWVGRHRVEEDEVSLPLCRRIAALLDLKPELVNTGDELPFDWSFMLFPEIARQSALGADGHPCKGDFLPPVELPNRRFAGRSVTIYRPLRIGESVERLSTIASIEQKQGRSGHLVFVSIVHEVTGHDGPAYTERQNIVYLEETTSPVGSVVMELPEPMWQESFIADPRLLFRYSAVTFNGHRIHYDADYTTKIEGYPALVINGGLTTLRLLELARSQLTGRIAEYHVRAIRPLFADKVVQLRGAKSMAGGLFWAVDDQDRVAMKIDITTA